MLNIQNIKDGDSITMKLDGKLNSVTSPEFKEAVFGAMQDCQKLILDFSDLQYVASAGLRVILESHKEMVANSKCLSLTNVDDGTMEILSATGLTRFLTIE